MGNGGCLGWAHGLMGETGGLAQAWFYLLQMSQCRWEDIGNDGSRSTLQTEKHLIYMAKGIINGIIIHNL